MAFNRSLLALGMAVAGAGCAIHPLPEDVTGDSTYEIVRKIRCEAREAIQRELIALLKNPEYPLATQELGRRLELNGMDFKQIDLTSLDPETRRYVEMYDGAAIAYEFTFDITENNNVGGNLSLLNDFTDGAFSLGFGAAHDRQRNNKRNFRVTDTFAGLIYDVKDEYCAVESPNPNWVYPITGEIGLAEMIDTFTDLNETGSLAGAAGEENLVPTLADTLEFQTKISGSISPTIELSPVPPRSGFHLASASFTTEAIRLDTHSVTIALSLPDAPPRVRTVTVPARIAPTAGRGSTSAEIRAVQELDRQQDLDFLDATRDIERRLDILE